MTCSPKEIELIELARKEGWQVSDENNSLAIITEDRTFPLAHPYQIHLALYRDAYDVSKKLRHMMAVHHLLWPRHILTWNYWQERRFEAHCAGYERVTMAGGAAIGKSIDAAKIGIIFFLSRPKANTVIVASVTLESLESRIWGYVVKLASEAALALPIKILEGKPPKIKHPDCKNKIHGMFAIAIKLGDTEQTLGTVIGRHPDYGLIIFLDEATDITPNIINALPNLRKGVSFFQAWFIGNSSSRNDLHGASATPLVGWDAIDPMRDKVWPTTTANSVCLYFNPYDSPAIHEKEPVKKAALSEFLITREGIEKDVREYGADSASFYRFTLGFWRPAGMDDTTMSEKFLSENEVARFAEWSGFYPLKVVAGLDPEFRVGGRGCVLRFALYGHTVGGKVVLDYRKEELLFRIDIQINVRKSTELQIAEQVLQKLHEYECPLGHLAIDCTGVGRAIGELIRLQYEKVYGVQAQHPLKIVSARVDKASMDTDPSITVMSPTELWFLFRRFAQEGQIRGLDEITLKQVTGRLVIKKPNGKLMLETKEDYKTRMTAITPALARSPDEADTAMLCLQAAVRQLGFAPGQTWAVPMSGDSGFIQKALAWQAEQQGVSQQAEALRGTVLGLPPLVANFRSGIESLAPGNAGRKREGLF